MWLVPSWAKKGRTRESQLPTYSLPQALLLMGFFLYSFFFFRFLSVVLAFPHLTKSFPFPFLNYSILEKSLTISSRLLAHPFIFLRGHQDQELRTGSGCAARGRCVQGGSDAEAQFCSLTSQPFCLKRLPSLSAIFFP